MFKDPIVEELRANADKIAEKFNYDSARYARHLQKIQKKYGGRLVSFSTKTGKSLRKALDGNGRKARNVTDKG